MHTDELSSGALNFDPRFYLHPSYVHLSTKSSGKTAQDKTCFGVGLKFSQNTCFENTFGFPNHFLHEILRKKMWVDIYSRCTRQSTSKNSLHKNSYSVCTDIFKL